MFGIQMMAVEQWLVQAKTDAIMCNITLISRMMVKLNNNGPELQKDTFLHRKIVLFQMLPFSFQITNLKFKIAKIDF